MAISNVTTATDAAHTAQTTANSGNALNTNFSEFLTLLTTQLQNQDPMNPMDSAQFTQQLVMYSQVEQQLSTNAKLDNMTSLAMTSSLSLALGYVGKSITYNSAEMNFDGSSKIDIHYTPTANTATTTINIYDSEGEVVYSKAGVTTAQAQTFSWDGTTTQGTKVPAGTYSVKILATDQEGQSTVLSTAVTGMVKGVESQDGVPNLIVGERAVPITNVINASIAATGT